MLTSIPVKAKRFAYRLALLFVFVGIILVVNGVITPTIAYATDSGEEATDSEATTTPAETASSEVIQTSEPEAATQTAVEGEEPAEATADVSQTEPIEESSPPEVVTETVTSGGDDSSHQIPIEVPVIYDGVEYTNIYATTNSVITFGRPDGTYSTYPQTPSISIYSRDWWARPSYYSDEWFIIRTSSGGFQVDGSYRRFGTNYGETTNIVITAQIQTDGTVSYTYSVSGPLYGNERTGARLHDGSVVSLEEADINEVEQPTELEATPAEPTPEPEVLPEPEPIPDPEPSPSEPESTPNETEPETPAPQPAPIPTPPPAPEQPVQTQPQQSQPVQPTPQPVQQEPAQPTVEPSPEPTPQDELEEIISNPASSIEERVDAIIATLDEDEAVTLAVLISAGVDFEDLPPETPIELRQDADGNAVVIDAETAANIQLITDPQKLVEELFTDPASVVSALTSVGQDMSEEEREESQEVVIASVVVANVANLASNAAAAGGAVAYRRKP